MDINKFILYWRHLRIRPRDYVVILSIHALQVAGESSPSVRRISEIACLSQRTVRSSLRVLSDNGIVGVTQRRTESGCYEPNLYDLSTIANDLDTLYSVHG